MKTEEIQGTEKAPEIHKEEIKGVKPAEAKTELDGEFNAAYGCVVGAFCGDALGGPLEFDTNPLDSGVKEAMSMQGGGPHNLQPGQITDDSEMALCVAHGISNMDNPDKEFDLRKIVQFYGKWFRSPPFDIGHTTHNAIRWSDPKKNTEGNPLNLWKAANKMADSQSNGSLMRSSPLAVYVSKIVDNAKLEEVVRAEISLTHGNKDVQAACICYCIAIRELIRNWNKEDRREKAFEAAKKWAEENSKILTWFKIKEDDLPNPIYNQGWSRIAFSYSFYFLMHKEIEYEKAMEQMIKKGGDTDTNAAIVGGLIGAAEGFTKLPERITQKMLACDSVTKGHKRPEFLCPLKFNLKDLIKKVYDKRPTEPKVVPDPKEALALKPVPEK